MESDSIKVSPFDLLTTFLKGRVFDQSNVSESGEPTFTQTIAILVENRELLMLLTTSVAVLIGCIVVLVWRRSSSQKSAKAIEVLKIVVPKFEEPEVDDGKKKVTIFLGTQTGISTALPPWPSMGA